MERNHDTPKLAMIGVDAGDLEFILAHLDDLPTFRSVLKQGTLSRLATSSALLSGSVWPTFFTGSLPGEHGVYHHLQWDRSRMKISRVSDGWLYSMPFWYRLAGHGVRVMVADVPMIFPTRLSSGVEIVNWGSHDQLGRFHGTPAPLARELRRRFGRHPMGMEIPVRKTASEVRRIRDNLVKGALRKGEVLRWLMRQREWDCLLAVFGECHRGGHILWPDSSSGNVVPPDALLDVYRAVDRSIAAVREDLGSVPLVLFSLHGMETNRSQEHFVPAVMERINARYRGNIHAAGNTGHALPGSEGGIMRHLRRALPPGLQSTIARAVPVGVRDWVVNRAAIGGLNWADTPAFSLVADCNGYIRFNRTGRERSGILETGSGAEERYVDLLVSTFRELRVSGTDEPLVRDIVPIHSVYPGAREDSLPDLIITWQPEESVEQVYSSGLGTIEARRDTGRSGNHRNEGFMVTNGITDGIGAIEHIVEIAPWVERYFEIPVPA